jgi:hypothetical protein
VNRDIAALPLWAMIVAYVALGYGVFIVAGFLIRYMTKLPWRETEEGRHLVAMSANVGAFFVLYLALTIWPEFPGRSLVRFGLFFLLLANCTRRWYLLEEHFAELEDTPEEPGEPEDLPLIDLRLVA